MSEKKIEIGGRLHSIATGNVLAGANEIFDDDKNKKQSEINTETYSLVNDVNERLNGLSPDQQSALTVAAKATNNETKLGYYVCGTEGNVAAKVISDATGYILSKGGSMKVKMTNANTAANATLNINSTGAKPLYYDGERASVNNSWEAGETVEVYYDGTNYYANNVAGGSGSGDGAFDISAKTGQNYETLTAALTAANTILPASKKKGGMSIKFVLSSDNTYVQYRLMLSEFTAAQFAKPVNWQGVDTIIKEDSKNLVENDAIFVEIKDTQYWNTGIGAIAKSTGLPTSAASLRRTTYLPVNKNYDIILRNMYDGGNTYDYACICFYDSDKSPILPTPTITTAGHISLTIAKENIPENAVFFRCTCSGVVVGTIKNGIVQTLLSKYNILDEEVVKTVQQSLTDNQKNQAVENLGLNNVIISDDFIDKNTVTLTRGYYNTNNVAIGNTWTPSILITSSYRCAKEAVVPGDRFDFYGVSVGSTRVKPYVITDSNNQVIFISSYATADYRQNPMLITIPENGAYLYVNFNNYSSSTDKLLKYGDSFTPNELYDTQQNVLKFTKKTIVCFGDSITEFSDPVTGKRYSDILADVSGATVINVGIGGTRLQQRATPADTPSSHSQAFAALDIVNMITASCEQDFTKQVNAAIYIRDEAGSSDDNMATVTRLQNIDWSKVDAVTILGGTNDWTGSDAEDIGETGSFDKSTTLGAINYMLRLLTYTYPNISVYFITPPMRYMDSSFKAAFTTSRTFAVGDRTLYNGRLYEFTSAHSAGEWNAEQVRLLTETELYGISSDVKTQNSYTLKTFSAMIANEVQLSHIPILDLYNKGWNAYNYTTALSGDLTHPLYGMDKIGKILFAFLNGDGKFK